jgi:hypothetical protein
MAQINVCTSYLSWCKILAAIIEGPYSVCYWESPVFRLVLGLRNVKACHAQETIPRCIRELPVGYPSIPAVLVRDEVPLLSTALGH